MRLLLYIWTNEWIRHMQYVMNKSSVLKDWRPLDFF